MPESSPHFDAVALEKLRKVGGDSLVRKMVALFLEYAPERLQTAREACEREDLETVERLLHSFKTSSAHVGATRLRHLAQEGETLASEREAGRLGAVLSSLEQGFEDVRESLLGACGPDAPVGQADRSEPRPQGRNAS